MLIALRAMVWEGAKRVEAAAKANMSEHSLYVALRRPHVRAWYLAEIDVLRTSERARNIFTLAEVRDQTANQMARVQAVKALEQLSDDPQHSGSRVQTPGFVIQIVNHVAGSAVMTEQRPIEPKPLIDNEPVRDEP